jgi:peptide/nickel transport system ATP-binding protein
MAESVLRVEGLKTSIDLGHAHLRAVDGIDLDLRRGETLAVVGESGCGKSMAALSILRLLPDAAQIDSGSAVLGGIDVLRLPESDMRDVRGRRIGIVFQEPGTSLNPVMTVGDQIREVLKRHSRRGGNAGKRALDLLSDVGIPEPARRLGEYPFQLSGGMKQRVMIAIALAADPDVLIADEPTTALDVTIQAQVLDLLRDLQVKRGMSILLITHDLGIVARMAHRVAVMYAGQIVEIADRDRFFGSPSHPYSRKLFAALPGPEAKGQLAVIRGQVPALTRSFSECRFADRCDFASPACRDGEPRLLPVDPDSPDAHRVRCVMLGSGIDMSAGATAISVHRTGARLPARLPARYSRSAIWRCIFRFARDCSHGCVAA